MKKLLFIFSFLICAVMAYGQYPNNQNISNNQTRYHIPIAKIDSSLLLSIKDTLNNQSTFYPGALTIRPQDTIGHVNPPVYMSNGRFWNKLGPGVNIPGNFVDSAVLNGNSLCVYYTTGVIRCYTLPGNGGCQSGKQFGDVVWDSLLVFHSTLMDYYIGCRHFQAPPTNFTLTPAFPSNPRTDVWVVDTFGVIRVVTGSISGLAYQPDPASELEVAHATIAAGAVVPSGISNLSIYKENVHPPEWTGASVMPGVLFNYPTNPFLGDSSTYIPSFVNGDIVEWQDLLQIYDVNDFSFIKFYVRLGAVMNSGAMNVTFYNGAVQATSTVTINNGQYGFNSSLVGTYQLIAIPFQDFLKIYPFQVNLFQIQFTGTGGALQFDNIVLQAGGQGVGTSGVIDITGHDGSTRSGHYVIKKPDIGWFYDSTHLNADSTYEYHFNNGTLLDSAYNPHDLIFGSSSVTIIPSTVGFRRAYTFTASGGGTQLFYDSTSLNYNNTKYVYYSGGVAVDSVDTQLGVNLGNANLIQSDLYRTFNMDSKNLSFINLGTFNIVNGSSNGLHMDAIGNQVNDQNLTAYGIIATASAFKGPNISSGNILPFYIYGNVSPVIVTNTAAVATSPKAFFKAVSDDLGDARGTIPFPVLNGVDQFHMTQSPNDAQKDYGIGIYNKTNKNLFISDSTAFRKVLIENSDLNVAIGDTLLGPITAQLWVPSTTKGVLFAPMNTTQMNAISSPANGLMIYNTDSACYCSFTGSAWVKMCGGTGGGGTVYSASNGLDLVGTTFELGGSDLNHNTSIGLDGNKFSFETSTYDAFVLDPSNDTFAIRQVHSNGSEDLIKLGDDGSGSALIELRVNDVANGLSGDYTFQSSGSTGTGIDIAANRRMDYQFLSSGTLISNTNPVTGNSTIFQQGVNSIGDAPFIDLTAANITTGNTSSVDIKDTAINISTPLLRINGVPYGGGGGSETFDQVLTNGSTMATNHAVDLGGFTFNFGTGVPFPTLSLSDTLVSLISTDGVGTSALLIRASASTGYTTSFYADNGTNSEIINLDAVNHWITYGSGVHIFTGDVSISPSSGALTDSILTWNSANNIIRRMAASSIISSHQITGQEFTGSTSTTLTLSQNFISGTIEIWKNGILLNNADFTEAPPNQVTLNVARLSIDMFKINCNY